MHRKQTLLFSTSSLRLPSKGKPSSSALVNTVRMCTTSSKVKSKVCKAVAQCSCQAKISLRLATQSHQERKSENETQTSTISTASTEGQSSDSVTPTSQYSTPKFEGGRSPSPALDESSLAQMQERLHAEFLQSVSFKQVYYLVDTVLENH